MVQILFLSFSYSSKQKNLNHPCNRNRLIIFMCKGSFTLCDFFLIATAFILIVSNGLHMRQHYQFLSSPLRTKSNPSRNQKKADNVSKPLVFSYFGRNNSFLDVLYHENDFDFQHASTGCVRRYISRLWEIRSGSRHCSNWIPSIRRSWCYPHVPQHAWT